MIISALQVTACAYATHLASEPDLLCHSRQSQLREWVCSASATEKQSAKRVFADSRQTKVAAEAADLRLQKAAYRLSSEFADGAHQRANIKQNNSNLLQHARGVIRLATSCWPIKDA